MRMGKEESVQMEHVRLNEAQWQSVLHKRILFGHQSVGEGILAGLAALADEAGVSLAMQEGSGGTGAPGITHFRIGTNGDPASKMKAFAEVVEGSGGAADVAMMKLCFVDFDSRTDAVTVARTYCSTLERLSRACPRTIFLAVTAPLTTVQLGPKAWLKGLLGRAPSGYAENLRRQQFNTVVRDTYGRRGLLFDLAKIESRVAGDVQYEGTSLEVLAPELTYDGGHLNTRGQRVAAESLLTLLSSIPPCRR